MLPREYAIVFYLLFLFFKKNIQHVHSFPTWNYKAMRWNPCSNGAFSSECEEGYIEMSIFKFARYSILNAMLCQTHICIQYRYTEYARVVW